MGKDLLRVSEPARLGPRGLLLMFEVLRRVGGLLRRVANTMVPLREHAKSTSDTEPLKKSRREMANALILQLQSLADVYVGRAGRRR